MSTIDTESGTSASSRLTGREFGGYQPSPLPNLSNWETMTSSTNASNVDLIIGGSSFSLSDSTYRDRPKPLLKSTESLVSVTSGSRPPSEHDIISLTPPENSEKPLRRSGGSHLYTMRKLVLGLVIVVLIALSWVGSTQTAKSSFVGNFNGPFFMVWFGTGWMMVVFPLTSVLYFATNRDKCNRSGCKMFWRHCMQVFSYKGLTLLSLLTSTVPFTLIWVSVNYMYVRALTTIEATDVTALFSSAPAFVFVLSLIVLREPLLIFRLVAVVLAVCGIVLFAYEVGFNTADSVHSIVGVALAVGSAIGAALYKVLLKVRLKESSIYQMSVFLTSIGLFSTFFLWPVVLILHFTEVESLHQSIPWGFICASSALSVLFNFSINFGIAYTYPLFISLGTVLGIPANAAVDVVARNMDILNWKLTAVDLIVGGFLLMLLPPSDSVFVHRLLACQCMRETKRKAVSVSN